ncbi:hypothetical protein OTU49_007503, partial [Cherax quadricarinatus]
QFGLRFNLSGRPGGLLPVVGLGIDSNVIAQGLPPGQYPPPAFLGPYTHSDTYQHELPAYSGPPIFHDGPHYPSLHHKGPLYGSLHGGIPSFHHGNLPYPSVHQDEFSDLSVYHREPSYSSAQLGYSQPHIHPGGPSHTPIYDSHLSHSVNSDLSPSTFSSYVPMELQLSSLQDNHSFEVDDPDYQFYHYKPSSFPYHHHPPPSVRPCGRHTVVSPYPVEREFRPGPQPYMPCGPQKPYFFHRRHQVVTLHPPLHNYSIQKQNTNGNSPKQINQTKNKNNLTYPENIENLAKDSFYSLDHSEESFKPPRHKKKPLREQKPNESPINKTLTFIRKPEGLDRESELNPYDSVDSFRAAITQKEEELSAMDAISHDNQELHFDKVVIVGKDDVYEV